MIGVFDSGYGGLTVLKELLRTLPQYDYLYLGDNARAPYGGRSRETILDYSRQAIDHLFDQGARLIITACNTVSAVALRQLQEEYLRAPNVTDRKILGVIFPLVEAVAERSETGKIGVVGTRATVDSAAYVHEFTKLRPDATVHQQACPLLVPFIEEGWECKSEAKRILKKYLLPLKSTHIDTLILGCTHYPLMHDAFERVMGKSIHVLDTGPTVAASTADYLKRHPEIESLLAQSKTSSCRFMTTADPDRFQELGSRFLGQSIEHVEKVELC